MDKPRNAYERLVQDVGEEQAKEEMRQRRLKVKNPGFKSSEEARRVANIRWSKYAKDNKGEGPKDEITSR